MLAEMRGRWKFWWVPCIAAATLFTLARIEGLTSAQTNVSGCVPVATDLPPIEPDPFQLADLVFPRKVVGEKPSDFVLTLRFAGESLVRNSQIVVSKTLQGGYIVTYYALPAGSKSIGEQAYEFMARSKIHDPMEIVKQIKVEVRNVNVPPELLLRQLNRMAKLSFSPMDELDIDFVHLHAGGYQFWLQKYSNEEEFYVCLGGDTYGSKHTPHSLVRWMNEMRKLVETYDLPARRAP